MSGRSRPEALPPTLAKYVESAEAALAVPFKGITADGMVVPGLFPLTAATCCASTTPRSTTAVPPTATPESSRGRAPRAAARDGVGLSARYSDRWDGEPTNRGGT
jgi:hypothetical protein